MTTVEWHRAIDEALTITSYLYLHVQGEPLLHSEIEEIFNYCDTKNCFIQLVTNGTYLSKYKELYKHPSLRKLSISLQSIEYQNIDIDEYIKEVLSLCERFPRDTNQYLELRFWRKDEMNKTNTQMLYKKIIEKYHPKDTNKPNNYELDKHIYLTYDNSFAWPNMNDQVISNQGYCLGGIEQLAILADGTLTTCCLDINGHNSLGNINSNSLKELLNTIAYQSFITNMKERKLINDLCQKCTYIERFKK